ncbi:vanadium-dependent haloperoxidase [Streptomyces sp. JJ36]|uniref:vanadium-dependent haloperoxidase n=1 Tax=Streptomyces sp. JJ36 TaxID=2736645 RepID=UPI001F37CC4F|nr:vanadium-dependent haloperoxidase [Streptomyces sp. JJ36]MCF6523728.1 phosphatase PAP2 family protein [Streptomyces sp. JJ36]
MTGTRSGLPARRLRRRALAVLLALLAAVVPHAVTAPAASAAAQAEPDFSGDPVHYWNQVLLDVFRRQDGGAAAPGPLSRAAAMMHLAVYDAESAYRNSWHTLSYEPYLAAPAYSGPPLQEGPHEEERVIGFTARRVLVELFEDDAAYINQRFEDRFGAPWDAFDILKPLVADPTAERILAERDADGSEAPGGYTPDGVPGSWAPTGEEHCQVAGDAVTPRWGDVTPFALERGDQFRPPTPGVYHDYPTLLSSAAYRAQRDEVHRLGGRDSADRTTDQTAAAWFWANDADGTYKPPGQLLETTATVSRDRGLSTYENARLFALVSMALADAAIASWDVKYGTAIDLWRPQQAIHAELGDTSWTPLGPNPCFPAWASGHATFAGAWAGTMQRVLGTDGIAFTVRTDDPNSPVATRRFTSFSAAAEEDALSRLYLGVHYRWDADDGLALGDDVAGHVVGTRLGRL